MYPFSTSERRISFPCELDALDDWDVLDEWAVVVGIMRLLETLLPNNY